MHEDTKKIDAKRKVVLLGDGAVGKTSLVRSFVYSDFDDKYIATIGTKVTKRELTIPLYKFNLHLQLLIWDILGQKGYSRVQWAGFRGSYGAFMVCDLTRKETLLNLERYWIPELQKVVKNIPMIFLANKVDLIGDAEIDITDIKKLADKYKTTFYLTSARTGENVAKAFYHLAYISFLSTSGDAQPPFAKYKAELKSFTIVDATDKIISDFCMQGGYENIDLGMDVIREQFMRANVDIAKPTKDGLRKVVEYLVDLESMYLDADTVKRNAINRLRLIHNASE